MSVYKSVEEIIAEAKQREADDRAGMETSIGEVCDAIQGFIDISMKWKTEVDNVFRFKPSRERMSEFMARAMSLSVLTNRILETAQDIPRTLMAGALSSTVMSWRYVAETKNIALMIDLDIEGPMGFLWLHYGMIGQAKVDGAGDDSKRFAAQAKRILADAGYPFSRKPREPWSQINGQPYPDSIARSDYVWRNRKFPPEASQPMRADLAAAEQRMIRASNMFSHPSLTPREILKGKLHPMMVTTVLDIMAVMLAYKVAASDAAEWPYTKTVGEQFHVYPPEEEKARALSFMVRDMYDYCFQVFHDHFLS